MNEWQKLIEYAKTAPEGEIADPDEWASLLAPCWGDFEGSDAESMGGYKLHGRMEKAFWRPPLLSFQIDRHGGTVQGSTRAAIQHWEVDLDKKTACGVLSGFKQLRPIAKRLYVRPLAEKTRDLVLGNRVHEWLKWTRTGEVRILIGMILPDGSAAKQTVSERRRRFREELATLLGHAGWKMIRANLFAPPDGDS